jgi:hypothetical protein
VSARHQRSRLKFLEAEAKLLENFEEEGRTDFAPAVERNRQSPAVGMNPTLVAAVCRTLENPRRSANL